MRQSWRVGDLGVRDPQILVWGIVGVAGGRGRVVKHSYIAVNRKFV